MSFDSFILRIIIILIPGIVGYKTYRILCSSGKKQKQLKDWEDFFNILVFSLFSYIVLKFFILLVNFIGMSLSETFVGIKTSMLDAILDQNISVSYSEIFFSLLVSILIGIISATMSNKKLIFRFFKWIKVTRHYGDEDIWSYINNSSDIEWVIVRDHKYELMYYSYIMLFSDYGEKRELLLGDVDVYSNNSGDFIYHTDKLYICRDEYDLSIEITKTQKKGEGNE